MTPADERGAWRPSHSTRQRRDRSSEMSDAGMAPTDPRLGLRTATPKAVTACVAPRDHQKMKPLQLGDESPISGSGWLMVVLPTALPAMPLTTTALSLVSAIAMPPVSGRRRGEWCRVSTQRRTGGRACPRCERRRAATPPGGANAGAAPSQAKLARRALTLSAVGRDAGLVSARVLDEADAR